MAITVELKERYKKNSSSKLIEMMEKGGSEQEKGIIISILKERGSDINQLKNDSLSEKIKTKSVSLFPSKNKLTVFCEDDNYQIGNRVEILNDSLKHEKGTTGTITRIGHWKGKPNAKFAFIELSEGLMCSRMLRFLKKI